MRFKIIEKGGRRFYAVRKWGPFFRHIIRAPNGWDNGSHSTYVTSEEEAKEAIVNYLSAKERRAYLRTTINTKIINVP